MISNLVIEHYLYFLLFKFHVNTKVGALFTLFWSLQLLYIIFLMLVCPRFTSDENGTRISVVQYFRQKYNIVLRYASWPSLQAGSDQKPIYLPMEVYK